jgi:hypothetical protein
MAGLAFGLAALAFCSVFALLHDTSRSRPTFDGKTMVAFSMVPVTLAASAAAFLVGFLLWCALVAIRRSGSRGFALLAGAIIGAVSHPVTWLLLQQFSPANVPDSRPGLSTIFSLILVGWLTVPLAAVVGLFLPRLLRSFGFPPRGIAKGPGISLEDRLD